jgi:hypothetical protein
MSEVEMVAAACVAGVTAGVTDSLRSGMREICARVASAVRREEGGGEAGGTEQGGTAPDEDAVTEPRDRSGGSYTCVVHANGAGVVQTGPQSSMHIVQR